jgi:hypothetical protein
MTNKVFLGGTCAETTWRSELIKNIEIDYFNPVVEDWSPKDQEIEETEKRDDCNIHLYIITKEMIGVFSIAEAVESVHMNNKTTILQIIPRGFNEAQLRSLNAVLKMIKKHGGIGYIENDLHKVTQFLNSIQGALK